MSSAGARRAATPTTGNVTPAKQVSTRNRAEQMHHKLCRSLARSIDDQNDPATHLAGDPASLEADQEPSRSCSQGSLARRKSTLRARRSETSYNAQVLLSNKIYAILPRAAVPDVHRKTLRQTTARSKSSPVRVSQEEQPTEATRRQRIPQCRYSHEYDFTNDPSAGSPTETLLRLLLPLSNKVHDISSTRFTH